MQIQRQCRAPSIGNQQKETKKKKLCYLRSARPVRRAWPCKHGSLFPSRSTLLTEITQTKQNKREIQKWKAKNETRERERCIYDYNKSNGVEVKSEEKGGFK